MSDNSPDSEKERMHDTCKYEHRSHAHITPNTRVPGDRVITGHVYFLFFSLYTPLQPYQRRRSPVIWQIEKKQREEKENPEWDTTCKHARFSLSIKKKKKRYRVKLNSKSDLTEAGEGKSKSTASINKKYIIISIIGVETYGGKRFTGRSEIN